MGNRQNLSTKGKETVFMIASPSHVTILTKQTVSMIAFRFAAIILTHQSAAMGLVTEIQFGILISNWLMYIFNSHCHKNSNRNLISLLSSTLLHQAWFLYEKQAKVASSYVVFVTQYVIQIYHIPQQFHYHDMSIFDHHSREKDYM